MRHLLTAPLLLAALAGLSVGPPPAGGRPPAKPVQESFTTADGVRLKGLFHRSPAGAKQGDAVVVLLYPPGAANTMLKGDWDGLVAGLNDAGFHVFRFDWRGHGQSTDITDPLGDNTPLTGFWVNQFTGWWNQRYVRGVGRRPVKNDIRVKTDIPDARYFPVYVTDLAAARLHLDQKNDQGDVNTSSIYLVGAGDTATLGMMWLAAEWHRPAVAPMLPGGLQYKVVPTRGIVVDPPAGADVAGAVWLTAGRPGSVPEHTVKGWAAAAAKLRDNNKMLFLYGADDADGERDAEAFYHRVLVADGKRGGPAAIEQTFLYPVPKTRLDGVDLLGRRLDPQPEAKVLEYLAARQKDRVTMTRKTRNYVTPYYIDVNYFLSLR